MWPSRCSRTGFANAAATAYSANGTSRRVVERFAKITLIDLLTDSVCALAAEMHRLGKSVRGVHFVRSGDFIKNGFTNNLDNRIG
jgi:hypothetical protein